MARSKRISHSSSLRCLHAATITNGSGFDISAHPAIESVREGYFRKMNWAIVGEVPKDFLRIYEYGAINRSRMGDWLGYIAKSARSGIRTSRSRSTCSPGSGRLSACRLRIHG